MFPADQENILLVVAGTIMFLLLGIFIIGFLFFYQKKRTAHLAEQEQLHSAFSQEILTTRIEVQEQTLNYISQELHDNIGQVLSFVKLNLGTANTLPDADKQLKINESRDLIAQAITDLRDLSKSMSLQHISQHGLVKAIQAETERVNKSGLIKAHIQITGDVFSLGEQRELVLFRIFQEALNNALKYAQASRLDIILAYQKELFNLTIADDGIGFINDHASQNNGSGLKNMTGRAALIGAEALIESQPNKGCTIKISLNPFKQLNN